MKKRTTLLVLATLMAVPVCARVLPDSTATAPQDSIPLAVTTMLATASSSGEVSLPELMTPSPKATMVDRFGNYPTNLYTGLIDISIPIHTIQVGTITVPVEFRYHASGLKYDDLPMELGYGWTLMAGGMVNYSARGTGLDHPGGNPGTPFVKSKGDVVNYDGTNTPTALADQTQLDHVMNGQLSYLQLGAADYCDSEYDVYNYSFCGHSGQHYAMIGGERFSAPNSTLRMEDGYQLTARDEHGNHYSFGLTIEDDYGKTMSSYLTQIISATGKDTVNLTYQNIAQGGSNDTYRNIIADRYSITWSLMGVPGYVYESVSDRPTRDYRCPLLKEISSRNCIVRFTYSATRTHSLNKITIHDGAGALLRIINLEKTNERYLKAIRFCASDGTEAFSYGFEYNGSKPEGLYGVDYWGYCNSQSAPTTYVPNFQVGLSSSGSTYYHKLSNTSRDVNASCMKLGMLAKVIYPTGGYTSLEYEPHKAGGQLYGGLRVARTTNYDADGNLLEEKRYVYGENGDGNGRAVRPINQQDYITASGNVEFTSSTNDATIIQARTVTNVYGSFPKCSYFSQGSTVVYSKVTEYTGAAGVSEGWTEHHFTDFQDENYDGTKRGYTAAIAKWDRGWKCGKLAARRVYDSGGTLVYSLSNSYKEINRTDYQNLHVDRYFPTDYGVEILSTPGLSHFFDGSLYDYYDYYITSADYVPYYVVESKDGVQTKTYLDYNGVGQVTSQRVVSGEGTTQTTTFKRPYDYWCEETYEAGNPYNQLYDTMYQNNNLSPVIMQDEYRDGVHTGGTFNQYSVWNLGPQTVRQLIGTSYDTRLAYTYDARGNVRTAVKDGQEKVCFIWGHKGEYPVAEIRGYASASALTILGQALLDRLLSSASPSSSDMSAVEALRSNASLTGCAITTMYYGKNGLAKTVAPNGMQTTYDYDGFGRLSCVRDHEGKIIEYYEYDYKQ